MDTIEHNGTTLTQIGYCNEGRIKVFAEGLSEALALQSVATGDWLYQVHGDALDWRADLVLADDDGPLWTLDEPAMDLPEDERGPLPSVAWVCEGTVRRWVLEAPLTDDEREQVSMVAQRLLIVAANLADALTAHSPATFLGLAEDELQSIAREMNR